MLTFVNMCHWLLLFVNIYEQLFICSHLFHLFTFVQICSHFFTCVQICSHLFTFVHICYSKLTLVVTFWEASHISSYNNFYQFLTFSLCTLEGEPTNMATPWWFLITLFFNCRILIDCKNWDVCAKPNLIFLLVSII